MKNRRSNSGAAGTPASPRVLREESAQPLSRVGIIALVGFAVGIVWPRLAGVSLVPEAPREQSSTAVEEKGKDEPKQEPQQSSETKEIKPTDRLEIGPPIITSCIDEDGDKHTSCDELDSDSLVHSVLRSLASCPAANGAFGTLSLGMDLDFEEKKVTKVTSGQSTDLPGSVTKAILRCAEEGLASVKVQGVPAEYSGYRVYYVLQFKTPEQVISSEDEITPATGKATVRWRTALIRSAPDRESKVVERILSGARVVVTGRKGEWYRVKFDARGREGWVHGAALGLE